MKMHRLLMVLTVLSAGLYSCATKQQTENEDATADETELDGWPSMDSFHMTMAEAFHPYTDSANLAPLKEFAEEMAQEAENWAQAERPAKVNTDAVQMQLEKLKTDTRALADKVKAGATDEELGSDLTALHDTFHAIMESWHGAEAGHEHQN